jgi:hypothetical protein
MGIVLGDWHWAIGSTLTLSVDTDSAHLAYSNEGLKIAADLGVGGGDACYRTVSEDLTVDQRFTDDDFYVVTVYAPVAADVLGLGARFNTDAANYYFFTITPTADGFNHFHIKKSDAEVQGTPDWAALTQHTYDCSLNNGAYVTINTPFFIKADPDDPDTFNPTGATWKSDGGEWLIIPSEVPDEPTGPFRLANVPVALAGARDPKWRANIDGGRYLARRWETADYGVSALFSVNGLVNAIPLMNGIPVYLTHDSQDIVIDMPDGRRQVVADPWPKPEIDTRPLLGWVRGPIVWDALHWELLATIEPAGLMGAALLLQAARAGWGFSLTSSASWGRQATRDGMTVGVREVFTDFPELCCVEHPSMGGRFL